MLGITGCGRFPVDDAFRTVNLADRIDLCARETTSPTPGGLSRIAPHIVVSLAPGPTGAPRYKARGLFAPVEILVVEQESGRGSIVIPPHR